MRQWNSLGELGQFGDAGVDLDVMQDQLVEELTHAADNDRGPAPLAVLLNRERQHWEIGGNAGNDAVWNKVDAYVKYL